MRERQKPRKLLEINLDAAKSEQKEIYVEKNIEQK